jgi:hypothetical protein
MSRLFFSRLSNHLWHESRRLRWERYLLNSSLERVQSRLGRQKWEMPAAGAAEVDGPGRSP